jgi:hypothetical protein
VNEKGALPLASKLIATGVVVVMPLAGLDATAVAAVPATLIRLPAEQVPGSWHCAAQSMLVAPLNAASQARVVVLVRTARSTQPADVVPAVCAGTVACAPPAVVATMKPAVAKLVVQLFAAAQATPSGQHWRGCAAAVCSPDSVTVTFAPSAALGWRSVVVAVPLASKTSVVASSAPALAASVAVWPARLVLGFVHGLVLSAQALTVTAVPAQATLALASDNS